MINTIVRGIPIAADSSCKYLVRTYLPTYSGLYITAVWRLKEATVDFWWAKEHPEHSHLIKDDLKEDVMFNIDRSTCAYHWNSGKKKNYSDDLKELGALHLRVCKEIMDGEFFDGEIACI